MEVDNHLKFQTQTLTCSHVTLLAKNDTVLSEEYNFLPVIVTQILRNRNDFEQDLILESDSDEAVLCDSESDFHEDTVAVCEDSNVSGS